MWGNHNDVGIAIKEPIDSSGESAPLVHGKPEEACQAVLAKAGCVKTRDRVQPKLLTGGRP